MEVKSEAMNDPKRQPLRHAVATLAHSRRKLFPCRYRRRPRRAGASGAPIREFD